jgi:hypothetical protein
VLSGTAYTSGRPDRSEVYASQRSSGEICPWASFALLSLTSSCGSVRRDNGEPTMSHLVSLLFIWYTMSPLRDQEVGYFALPLVRNGVSSPSRDRSCR